jgi:hypothetical protein
MKRTLTLLLLTVTTTLFAQEKAYYFTRGFQHIADEKTENIRRYKFGEDSTVIEDYKNNTLQEKGTIYGLTKLSEVNEFAWYCIFEGIALNYRDYFQDVKGVFDFYTAGKIANTARSGTTARKF